jgi:hypothetical protein
LVKEEARALKPGLECQQAFRDGITMSTELEPRQNRRRLSFGLLFSITCIWLYAVYSTVPMSFEVARDFERIPPGFDGSEIASYGLLAVAVAFPFATLTLVVLAWLNWRKGRVRRAFLWMLVPILHYLLALLLFFLLMLSAG